ncbi:hypothetical protein [Pseudomonas kuykendallii]|uniref:Uncharacterized protein n=1 Tax=Pseudomonas kuykendallii TaxID=1007099 RepID=A0A2W5F2U3_9PSED|nr:hypothetical protein [Pseudomonas kuykendallii]PZP26706.1 MAG: hypothetical protein DI599_00680 [Pseudomonas kuykendallii]
MSELNRLNLLLGFQTWAEPRGYDLTTDGTPHGFTSLETRSAWLGYEGAFSDSSPRGQQLYARIRKSSKYAHQTEKLFEVRVGKAPYDDFVVHGGPGGVYALRDVHLYVLVAGNPIRLS